jgi:hypothetical protein
MTRALKLDALWSAAAIIYGAVTGNVFFVVAGVVLVLVMPPMPPVPPVPPLPPLPAHGYNYGAGSSSGNGQWQVVGPMTHPVEGGN